MKPPPYFTQVAPISLYDPLAELLGACEDGVLTYDFLDAVKLAGHACPTVASAWLATVRGLRALYGDDLPVRGDIAVALPDRIDEGVAGVIASIATLITGAAGDGGFKGLGGKFGRRGLLAFGITGVAGIRFSRRDTGTGVDCRVNLQRVPADRRLGGLLPGVVLGTAGPTERELFHQLWQDRVRRILIDHGDDPQLCEIRPATGITGI